MPIRNEAEHLPAAVAAVRSQEYPGAMRIFLGVGPSTDGTEAVAESLAGDDLVVVPNPSGTTPAGLNAAIRAGSAPVVVRVDGHSELSPGYVRRAVETMRSTGAVNVGGRQVPVPTTPFEEAVAAATTSWLGTGGASYRIGGEPGPVDTVFLGVFDRTAIEAAGLFRRAADPQPGLRTQHPPAAGRWHGVVRSRTVGRLPAQGLVAGVGEAVLRVRLLEGRGAADAPRVAAVAPVPAADGPWGGLGGDGPRRPQAALPAGAPGRRHCRGCRGRTHRPVERYRCRAHGRRAGDHPPQLVGRSRSRCTAAA